MTSTIDSEAKDTGSMTQSPPTGDESAAPSTVWYLTLGEWWRAPQSAPSPSGSASNG